MTAFVLLLSTCNSNISRNQDGSFDVETTLSQQELQEAVTTAIADPLVREIMVALQPGYVFASGICEHLNDPARTDALTFRLALVVSNGQLTVSISNTWPTGLPTWGKETQTAPWNPQVSLPAASL